eukprot:CAMPEP_0171469240 /NCGR_PEP_ID=MMETSP0945-20130129/11169_1 /TAXON_ID=109269 /ORGANISM="Vaucheria litorea, Strain CCMP2940" /LENGTH=204 /DNA_ID=CAMNT_0011998351 /DNA_START=497 /DNA_END=1111 /DNA_ORIENTATION=+
MENLSKSDIFDDFVSENAIKWAKFADDKLAILLYPNITRSFGESLQAFSYIKKVDSFNSFEKYSNLMIGSFAMWMAQGKIKKKYGIKDERESLQKAISLWTNEIKGRQFLGQNEPNLGDLCIFGCLRAIEGLDAFDDIMRDNVELDKWYKRVVKVLEYDMSPEMDFLFLPSHQRAKLSKLESLDTQLGPNSSFRLLFYLGPMDL